LALALVLGVGIGTVALLVRPHLAIGVLLVLVLFVIQTILQNITISIYGVGLAMVVNRVM